MDQEFANGVRKQAEKMIRDLLLKQRKESEKKKCRTCQQMKIVYEILSELEEDVKA